MLFDSENRKKQKNKKISKMDDNIGLSIRLPLEEVECAYANAFV